MAPKLGLAMLLPPASGTNGIASGNRPSASMLTRHLTDLSTLSFNPSNGNVALAGQLLHVKGAGRDLTIGWRYNSLNDARPTLSVGANEAAITVGGDNSVVYTARGCQIVCDLRDGVSHRMLWCFRHLRLG
ncbi:hypothetical protein GCM10023346_40810 [Arthrobacter gyeryongensis]|uniref:Uncharacterized protein n=1 Tax=Arthrobacter gyeryongensis TaxID=1650592 RepID=A0ABP9SSI3_9MICC